MLTIAGIAVAPLVRAQFIWNGSNNTNFSKKQNWSTNQAPTSATTTTLTFAGSTRPTPNNDLAAGSTFGKITFGAGATAFTIGGNAFVLNDGGSGGTLLTNSSSNTQTINAGITVGAVQTWSAATGALAIGGAVTLSNDLTLSGANALTISGTVTNRLGNRAITNNASGPVTFSALNLSESGTNRTLTINGTGSATVSGVIANGSTSTSGLTYSGSGVLTLAGSNTYSGGLAVNSGSVRLANSGAVSGSGATVATGASLQFAQAAGPANIALGNFATTINGTGVSGNGAIENISGSNSYAGAINLGSASGLKNTSPGTTLTLSGGVDPSAPSHFGLTVGGAGNVTATGALNLGSVTTTVINGQTVATGVGIGGTLTKTDSGTLTLGGTNQTSSLDGITLTLGNLTVAGTNTLVQAGPMSSSNASNVLTINSGNKVQSFFALGTSTTFTGQLAGSGTFQVDGVAIGVGSAANSHLLFATSFSAPALTLLITGGEIDLGNNVNLTFGTIHITGNTILDFNSSTATSLTSSNLLIDAGVSVTISNWASETDFWYATGSVGGTAGIAARNTKGSGALGQITFNNSGFSAANTTWIAAPYAPWTNNEIRPIPESATYGAILISGCLARLGWRRFRRSG